MKEKRWLVLLTTFIMMILSASVVFASETEANEETDYGIWFDSLRGDNYTWVFEDEEEYCLRLDIYDLEELGYTQDVELVWTVGQKNENGEMTNIIQPGENGIYTVVDAETLLDIDGVKMAEAGLEYLDVHVCVMVNGEDIGFEAETTVQLEETEVILYEDGYWNGYKGYQWIYSNDAMDVHIRSKDYPLGSDISLQIDNMTLQKTDENALEPSEVLEVTHEDSEWVITMQDYGYADVVFELTDPSYPDNQYTLTRTLVCAEDLYEMIIYTDTNSDKMLPGETLELRTAVAKLSLDEEGNEVISVLEEGVDYTATYSAAADWLYTVDSDGTVAAKNHFGESYVFVEATVNEEGKEPYVLEMDYWIAVTESYLRLALDSCKTEAGGAVSVDSLNPRILIHSVDNPEGIEYEPGIVEFYGSLEPEYYSVASNYTRLDINSELTCLDLPKTVLVECYAQLNGEYCSGFAEIYIESNYHVNW